MGDNGVYSEVLTDGIKFISIKHWILVCPIDITGQGLVLFRQMVGRMAHAIRPIDGNGTTDAKDFMATRPNHRIVGHCHPSAMLDGVIIKVGRVVMVASDEQNPVVRLGQTATITVIDVLIIALLLKPEATVTSNDNHRVRHSILDAALMDKLIKLAMNIATDDNAFSLWKIENSPQNSFNALVKCLY